MRTEHIKSVIVPDGFLGATIQINLCYDPESKKTIGVWTGGTFTSQVPLAVDATEAEWLINNHPACKQLR